MHPRNDQNQRCLTFHLSVSPRCRVFGYRDHLANHVHHFDIPGQHGQLVIVAESLVEMQPHIMVPESLPASAWDDLDRRVGQRADACGQDRGYDQEQRLAPAPSSAPHLFVPCHNARLDTR